MYTTTWCGYCRRLKSQLDRAGIAVKEIDIERQPGAAAVVERVNRGNRTVPTVVFADGTALTNPSVRHVQPTALTSAASEERPADSRRNDAEHASFAKTTTAAAPRARRVREEHKRRA